MKWFAVLSLVSLLTSRPAVAEQRLPIGEAYHEFENCEPNFLIGGAPGTAVLRPIGMKQKAPYENRKVEGWSLNINTKLIETDPAAIEAAVDVLRKQLKQIKRVVPAKAVKRLKEVTLWMNPEYSGVRPTAEYHPGREWLAANGRNPEMVKGVEFTDIPIFAQEYTRMPCFVLHELAHSFHDRVLGFDRKDVVTAFEHAKASKVYDNVERHNGEGRPNTMDRAYAMSNEREYFAESTEAYFGTNDFYPFNRDQLKKADPEIFSILEKVWFGKQ